MADLQSNSAKVLCEEIVARAWREGEDIVHRAQAEAQALIDKAKTESKRLREQRLLFAHTEALRRKDLILASVPIERARLDAARREALLESICEEVHRRLVAHEGFDYRESLLALAASAIARMPGNAFIIKVSPQDAAVFAELRNQIEQRVGRSLSITILNDSLICDGVLIESADARQIWDNRFSARLGRLWAELRQRVAFSTGLMKTGEKT